MKKDIYLAGASFWGGKAFLEALPGVEKVELGVIDANSDTVQANDWTSYPSSDYLGTTEVCKVTYNADTLPLESLIDAFFTTIDPHSLAKQINYSGPLPEAKVYYLDAADEVIVDKRIAALQERLARPVTVECLPFTSFEPIGTYAEDYICRNLGEQHVIPADAAEKYVAAHKDQFPAA